MLIGIDLEASSGRLRDGCLHVARPSVWQGRHWSLVGYRSKTVRKSEPRKLLTLLRRRAASEPRAARQDELRDGTTASRATRRKEEQRGSLGARPAPAQQVEHKEGTGTEGDAESRPAMARRTAVKRERQARCCGNDEAEQGEDVKDRRGQSCGKEARWRNAPQRRHDENGAVTNALHVTEASHGDDTAATRRRHGYDTATTR